MMREDVYEKLIRYTQKYITYYTKNANTQNIHVIPGKNE